MVPPNVSHTPGPIISDGGGIQPLQKKLGSSGFSNLDGKSGDGTPSWWEGKARKEEGKNKRTSVGGRGMRYKDGMEE